MDSAADLVLKQVKLFHQGTWQEKDLFLAQGKIAGITQPGAGGMEARESLNLRDRMVSPGWIDLHTHLLPPRWGGIGTHPDKLGLGTGVTALLDVGTTGANNFPLFYEKIITKSPTPIYALLNIKAHGIRLGKIGREREADVDLAAMAEAVKRYPDRIKGVKVTASKEHMLAKDPIRYVQLAREAGDRLGLPLMVHFGRTPPELSELLPLMKKGDLLTHTLRDGGHTILDREGKVREDVLQAQARGVRFDVGHGVRSFSFPVAEKALAQGFDGFSISSDLYILSRPFRAHNFAHVLSKFLALGMSVESVIERAGRWPADWLGLSRSLEPGAPAALTVFRLESGKFRFRDCWNQLRIGTQRIVPELCILGSEIFSCSSAGRIG